MNRFLWTSLVVALGLGVYSGLWAQEPSQPGTSPRGASEQGGEHRGRFGLRDSNGGDSEGRMGRVEGFLRMLDVDGNGILEPGEVPPERARMLQAFASRLGLDLTQPIPLARIREALNARDSEGSAPNASHGSGTSATAQPATPGQPKADQQTKPEAPSLVPGFGTNQVPGFGQSAPAGSVPVASAPTTVVSQSSDPRRAFREVRFRRYDRNGNGVLEKEEWSEMPGDSSAMDRNHDRRITLDEYLTMTLNVGPPHGRFGEASGSPPELGSPEKPEKAARKSYRFLQPQERLPEGLPSWFVERDKNQDGQVSMAEYTPSWSEGTAGEFVQLDGNGDGFITPHECLKGGGTKGSGSGSAASGSAAPTDNSGNKSGESTPWWMR